MLAQTTKNVIYFDKLVVENAVKNTSTFGYFTILNNDFVTHRITAIKTEIGQVDLYKTKVLDDFYFNYKLRSLIIKPGQIINISLTPINMLIKKLKKNLPTGKKLSIEFFFADGSKKTTYLEVI